MDRAARCSWSTLGNRWVCARPMRAPGGRTPSPACRSWTSARLRTAAGNGRGLGPRGLFSEQRAAPRDLGPAGDAPRGPAADVSSRVRYWAPGGRRPGRRHATPTAREDHGRSGCDHLRKHCPHGKGAFYQVFEPARADGNWFVDHRVQRPRHAPKHGRWAETSAEQRTAAADDAPMRVIAWRQLMATRARARPAATAVLRWRVRRVATARQAAAAGAPRTRGGRATGGWKDDDPRAVANSSSVAYPRESLCSLQ